MVEEHADIAKSVDRVQSLTADWTKSAEPTLTKQLSTASHALTDLVNRHLEHEERDAVPLIEKYMTQEEWTAATKQAASFISLRNLRLGIVLGGLVLDAGSEKERRKILAGAPVPQRIAVQLSGSHSVAAYRRRLSAN
jgi:hypothetical protein